MSRRRRSKQPEKQTRLTWPSLPLLPPPPLPGRVCRLHCSAPLPPIRAHRVSSAWGGGGQAGAKSGRDSHTHRPTCPASAPESPPAGLSSSFVCCSQFRSACIW